jgi:hypothetical protein
VALRPHPPVPQSVPQFFEPPVAPEPLRRLWTGVLAAASLIFAALGSVFKEIAARWRGIVLAHIFFLTLWLAVQVFFFASGAYWCFPNESSKLVEWFSKYFPQVSRCGPPVASHGVAASPTIAVSSFGSAKAAPLSSASTEGASAASPGAPAASSPSSPPLFSPLSPTAPFAGSPPAWSSKSIANCWRNRSVGSSSCYGRAEARRKRVRYPTYPCRRPSECGWNAS